jgi:predicted RNA polymerase sigma factor
MQAAIAACHAQAVTPADTDWVRIVALYDELSQLTQSPIVELNRAVAVGMAAGPQAALDLLDALAAEPSLHEYHLLPTVRGSFLKKLGRLVDARAEFERAASLTRNARERNLLLGWAPRVRRRRSSARATLIKTVRLSLRRQLLGADCSRITSYTEFTGHAARVFLFATTGTFC